jgi:hypothetical protein
MEALEHRLQRHVTRLINGLSSLPSGAVSVKTIRGRKYAYLVRRIGGRLRFSYLGPAGDPGVSLLRRRTLTRRRRRAILNGVRRQLKTVQSSLRPSRRMSPLPLSVIAGLPRPGRGHAGSADEHVLASMTVMEGRASIRFL